MTAPIASLLLSVFLFGLIIGIRMRVRRYYFIRHGETGLNAQHIRQGEAGELSERGRQQAEQVGQALKEARIRRIISSTYPRARETADIIARHVHAPVLTSPLLVERRNPSEIIGKSTRDPEVERIVDQVDLAYHEDSYRFSDEENFLDLKRRVRKCLRMLARLGVRDTVIVTHHHFLKMLLAYMLYRERLHAKDFVKLSFFNVSDNAGITVCEYHPWQRFSPTRGWKVISFNQQPVR